MRQGGRKTFGRCRGLVGVDPPGTEMPCPPPPCVPPRAIGKKRHPVSFAGWRCLFGQALPQGRQENEDVQDPHDIASLFLKKRATEMTR